MTRKDVPNLLTYLRLVLAVATLCGLLAAAYVAALGAQPRAATALVFASLAAFVLAASTDFLDGWLARRWDAGSAWGATLDPIADKLAVTAAVLGLVVLLPRPSVVVVGAVILFREVLVSGLREGGAPRGLRLPVTWLAKWKTAAQLTALALEMGVAGLRMAELAAGVALPWLAAFAGVADALLWAAAALTVITGAQYAAAARRVLSAPA